MGHINFVEDTHQYFNINTGEQYTSVSHVLGHFKEKFDTDTYSKRTALKLGISQEEVLAMWEADKNYACEKGTATHKVMENYIKFGEIEPDYKHIIAQYQEMINSEEIPRYEEVLSEILVYNDEYKVAGQSDICYLHKDGTFTIGDFKTNKRFNIHSAFGKWLKHPLNHLSECEFNTYTMQLSLYALMYEEMTGKKCRGLIILWLNPNTGKWVKIPCNYMKHEAIMLLGAFHRLNTGK